MYDSLQDLLDEVGDDPATIRLGRGTIDDIDDNLSIPSNTWLCGSGMFGGTTLKFADDPDLSLAGLLRVDADNVVVSDLELDGNRERVADRGNEYGLYTSGSTNVVLERVYCHDFPGYGIDPHDDSGRQTSRITIRDCLSERNGLDGFTLAGVEDAILSGCYAVSNDRHGVNATDPEGNRIAIHGLVSRRNGASGVVVHNGTDDVSLSSFQIADNGASGIRVGSSGGPGDDVSVGVGTIRGNESYGIEVRGSRGTKIDGTRFVGNATSNGNAEIAIETAGGVEATLTQVTDAQFRTLDGTAHAIDERDGGGPSLFSNNVIDGEVDEAISVSDPDSVVGRTLTS